VVLIRAYWAPTARGLGLSVIAAILGLVPPYLSKLYFDAVYPARDVSLMHALVVGGAAFSVATTVLGAIRGYYSQVISAKLSSAVTLMFFNHVQHLPVRFFDERRVGEIISRSSDMRASLGSVSRIFQTLLVNGVYLALVPPLLLALNWRLAVLALLTRPLTACISTASSRVTRKLIKRAAEAGADLSAIQVETITQIRTVKAMAAEHFAFRDAADRSEEALRLQLTAAGVGAMVGIGNAMIQAAGVGAFTWYAWTLILRGEMSLGSFVAFSAYLGYVTGPIGQVTGLFAEFQQTAVTLGRAFEYLDTSPEQDPARAYAPPSEIERRIRATVAFDAVTFGYAGGKSVLSDVSVTFPHGSITAVVGSSGAGKSTILRLICAMERPLTGTVLVDGLPIDQYSLSDLRRQIAVVWQDATLMRGTIWDNLTYGLDSVDERSVDAAVKTCQLEALIRSLPGGYGTMVAECGATLSGGQRQRLALARALIRNAPVLLLDETTSQVDVGTEDQILRELIPRVRGKTVILVTHRFATASIADRVCVLDEGRVVGLGTPEELSHDCDTYRQMMLASHHPDEHRRLRMLSR
jgi:ABC-type bacteriocin/lantibiotic exporter with double-glycine peptidase domain